MESHVTKELLTASSDCSVDCYQCLPTVLVDYNVAESETVISKLLPALMVAVCQHHCHHRCQHCCQHEMGLHLKP